MTVNPTQFTAIYSFDFTQDGKQSRTIYFIRLRLECALITDYYELLMSQIAKRIIFTGQVQGVGFRFTALSTANRRRLTGLVRNLTDGSVEMLAQGDSADVDDCIRDLEESFAGYIRETKIEDVPFSPQLKNFRITY